MRGGSVESVAIKQRQSKRKEGRGGENGSVAENGELLLWRMDVEERPVAC